jgi:hypothetical protein
MAAKLIGEFGTIDFEKACALKFALMCCEHSALCGTMTFSKGRLLQLNEHALLHASITCHHHNTYEISHQYLRLC